MNTRELVEAYADRVLEDREEERMKYFKGGLVIGLSMGAVAVMIIMCLI